MQEDEDCDFDAESSGKSLKSIEAGVKRKEMMVETSDHRGGIYSGGSWQGISKFLGYG